MSDDPHNIARGVLGAFDYIGMSDAVAKQHRNERRDFVLAMLDVASALQELNERCTELARLGRPVEPAAAVQAIETRMREALARLGAEPIETIGLPLDLFCHETGAVRSSDQPDGIVIEEIRKGWMFDGEVLRTAVVVVSGCETLT